jgi:hypothetical protein
LTGSALSSIIFQDAAHPELVEGWLSHLDAIRNPAPNDNLTGSALSSIIFQDAAHPELVEGWLPGMDSNHRKMRQRHLSYHWTTGQLIYQLKADDC